MAGQDGRDDEMAALLQIDGVDTAKITEQIAGKSGASADEPPKTDPPKIDPPKTDPPKNNVQDVDAIRSGILNEMFGDQFKTVDDVKKADIPKSLQELATLRQQKQELEAQLAKKPKHSFASDDIAKFNEFARETGIHDESVFKKINGTEIANMDDMDALVMQHIIENPSLAGKEPHVRRYFETKYNVDPKKVESGDLTQDELEINRIGITSDGARAKAKIQELKGKIKMPDLSADEPAKVTKWTPEIETKQKETWSAVNAKMGEEFSKIPITLKGGKEPIVNFVLPEEAKKSVLQNALDYVVSNQMEVNQDNVTSVAKAMYSDILFAHREDIYHAIFERARSMSEEEILKVYHNPSQKNTDTPPSGGGMSSEEEQRKKAADLEFKR